MSHGEAPRVPSSTSNPDATIYGPIVQGSKNNVTIKPTINAPFVDDTPLIILPMSSIPEPSVFGGGENAQASLSPRFSKRRSYYDGRVSSNTKNDRRDEVKTNPAGRKVVMSTLTRAYYKWLSQKDE